MKKHTKSRHLTDKATEEKKTRETADIHPDVQENTPFQSSEHAALTKPAWDAVQLLSPTAADTPKIPA